MQEYYSATMKYSSENGKTPDVHGSRNIVSVKNGQGFKQVETLNKNGEVVQSNKQTLSKNEIHAVMKGAFVPGFWSNCTKPVKKNTKRGKRSLASSSTKKSSKK